MKGLWTTLGLFFSMVIGLWKFFGAKNRFKKEEAKKAKKEFDDAIKNDDVSDFLDALNRLL